MKTYILIAGAAALLSTGPAFAQPAHAGKGKGQKAHVVQDHRGHVGHGAVGCPPGLAKKNNGCLPPGQAKKLFEMGQRVPQGYNSWTPYNRIPDELRRQYGLDDRSRYIYRDDYIYRVDPTTMVVQQILRGIL